MIFLRLRTFFLLAGMLCASTSLAKNPTIADYHDFDQPGFIAHIDDLFISARLANPIKVPRVAFTDVNGKDFSLRDFRGKLVVMPVWASWCMECMSELTTMLHLLQDLEYDDIEEVAIVPISTDFKSPAAVQEIYEAHKLDKLPLFLDSKKEVMGLFDINSLPATFLINEKGYIIARFNRHLPWNAQVVRENLLALLSKPPIKNDGRTNSTKNGAADSKQPRRDENFMLWQSTPPQSEVVFNKPTENIANPQDQGNTPDKSIGSEEERLPWHNTPPQQSHGSTESIPPNQHHPQPGGQETTPATQPDVNARP